MKIRLSGYNLIIFVLLFCITFGASIHIFGISVAGFQLTLFRTIVPLMAFFLYFEERRRSQKTCVTTNLRRYEFLMVLWVVYGLITLLLFPYADIREGTKELLSLILGFLTVCCIYKLVNTNEKLSVFLNGIKLIYLMAVVIAWIEMLTNIHLPSSILTEVGRCTVANSFMGVKIYSATSFFYNMNDYCAFLALFLPVIYIKSTSKNIIDVFLIISALVQVIVNDANLCLIGIVVAYFIYRFKREKHVSKKIFAIGIIVIALLVVDDFMSSSYYSGYSLSQIFREQSRQATLGSGSMWSRLIIYSDAIKTIPVTHGLGLGAAGFTPYFRQHQSLCGLVNPHNLFIEILSEYGVIIFTLFLCFYLSCFKQMNKWQKVENSNYALMSIAMMTSYIFSSMAPSSFLGYGYQWIMWGIVLAIEHINQEMYFQLK